MMGQGAEEEKKEDRKILSRLGKTGFSFPAFSFWATLPILIRQCEASLVELIWIDLSRETIAIIFDEVVRCS